MIRMKPVGQMYVYENGDNMCQTINIPNVIPDFVASYFRLELLMDVIKLRAELLSKVKYGSSCGTEDLGESISM